MKTLVWNGHSGKDVVQCHQLNSCALHSRCQANVDLKQVAVIVTANTSWTQFWTNFPAVSHELHFERTSWQFLQRSYSFTATPYSLESHSIVSCPRHTRQEEHFWNKLFTKSRSTVVYLVPTNFRCRAHSENTQFAISCRDRRKFCCFLLCTTLNDIQVRLG